MKRVEGLEKYKKNIRKERKEHPSLPEWAVRRIASDHLKKNRKMKGGIMTWFAALAGLFTISLLWIIFTRVLFATNGLWEIGRDTVSDTNALQTFDFLSLVWSAWPYIMIIGFVIMILVASQRREPEYYYR